MSKSGPGSRPGASTRTKVIAAGLFAATSVAAGVVVAAMAVPSAAAMGEGAKAATEVYGGLSSKFTTPPLPRKSVVTSADGTVLATLYAENREEVPIEQISPDLQHAIVAIEDSRFFEHNGVDVKGTMRAVANNASGDAVQGGSTITMQYIKNVLVSTADTAEQQEAATARSASRKLQEIRYAVELEKELTKTQILNNYLNISYFGAGAYGAEAASQRYFSKHANELTLSEAALLAGLVQSPTVYDPTVDPEAAQTRRNEVLDRMLQLGYITQEQRNLAVIVPVTDLLRPTVPVNGCAASIYPYYCDYAVRQVLDNPAFGETKEDREKYIETGGLTIKTALDMTAQDAAQRAVFEAIPAADESGKAAAIAMVRPGTGEVIAMSQNRTWGDEGLGQTTYNYSVNENEGGTIGMQAGSTFKIFTIANALEQGINPYEKVKSSSQMLLPGGDWGCGTGTDQGQFIGKNSSDYGGDYDMFTAAALSANTYFLQAERNSSMCKTVEMAKRAGVESAIGDPLKPTITFTLGVTEVSVLNVANAYATFAAHGTYCVPRATLSVVDRTGKTTDIPEQCTETIPRDVADATTAVLTNVVDGKINSRTGANMSLGSQESTGKTGTTDSNSAVWYAGYTPQLAAAVWVGDPRGAFKYPMTDVTINGVHYNELYGGELPGPIWKAAMQGALANSPTESFNLEAKYDLQTAAQGGGPDAAKSLAIAAARKSGSYNPPVHGEAPVPVKYTKDDPNKPGAPAPEVIDPNSSSSQSSSGQSGSNNGTGGTTGTNQYGTNTYNPYGTNTYNSN